MKRREFMALLGGAAAWPFSAFGQQRERTWRIGYLSPISVTEEAAGYRDEFRMGLRELGYIENKNLYIEFRYAERDHSRLTSLAAELVNLKVDAIVSYGLGGEAARHATALIPVVLVVALGDPLNALVSKLSHPGSNVTGSAILLPQLMLKRLELLKEVVPSMKRVGVLLLKDYPGNGAMLVPMETAAKVMSAELRPIEVSGYTDYKTAFSEWTDTQADAVVIADQPEFLSDAAALATLAERQQLASGRIVRICG
jgi:putative tryptophan/tyrosine transport system substrate-binding protein